MKGCVNNVCNMQLLCSSDIQYLGIGTGSDSVMRFTLAMGLKASSGSYASLEHDIIMTVYNTVMHLQRRT